MLKALCTFLFLVVAHVLSGQSRGIGCAVAVAPEEVAPHRQLNRQWLSSDELSRKSATTSEVVLAPVQFHILRRDDQSGGISQELASEALEILNRDFMPGRIRFYHCSPPKFIDATELYMHEASEMEHLDQTYSTPNVINIYVAGEALYAGAQVCGYAELPGGLDFLLIAKGCITNGSTLSHEMGHFFGLYHTHETAFGYEAVDGSDCDQEGDLICDTPADPDLYGMVEPNGCEYLGGALDEYGRPYKPSVVNMMSYSYSSCRSRFSKKQYSKMHWMLTNHRGNLSCGSAPLEAGFDVASLPRENGGTVTFLNTSKGSPSGYHWDFGDGSSISGVASPSHHYSKSGIYTVSLSIKKESSTDTFTRRVTVGAVSVPYFNDFEKANAALSDFHRKEGAKNKLRIDSTSSAEGMMSLLFDGADSSMAWNFTPPSPQKAFDSLWNPQFKAGLYLHVDGRNREQLQLEFYKRQISDFYDNSCNFRITINGKPMEDPYVVNGDELDFEHFYIDLSEYDGEVFTLGFEGSHKMKLSTFGTTATLIDNIKITEATAPEEIELFPNPATEHLSIKQAEAETAEIVIYNSTGQPVNKAHVRELERTANHLMLDVSDLPRGAYVVRTGEKTARFLKL